MSVIMGRGEDAKKAIENNGGGGSLDKDKAFIGLKAGQSRKVRILSPKDYVAYKAHGHFSKGIRTTPCIAPLEERCLLCEAANYNGEHVGGLIDTVKTQKGDTVSEYKNMYAKKRVLFALVDLEEGGEDEDENPEGMLRVFDATSNQADGLIATIDEYSEDLDDMAFTLKRTGDKQDTTYSLNPIMPKKMKDLQPTFDKYEEKDIPDEIFEEALVTRSTEDQAKDLQKAGFPVKEIFDMDVTSTQGSEEDAGNEKAEAKAKEENENPSDEDLPF